MCKEKLIERLNRFFNNNRDPKKKKNQPAKETRMKTWD